MRILKKGQSEMVGFGIIIIIIAVLILVFLSISINNNSGSFAKSYQTEAFVQSYLQFTTNCTVYDTPQKVLQVIKLCGNNEACESGEGACNVLNETSKNILKNSWQVGKDFPVKGYEFNVFYGNRNLVNLFSGKKTGESRGSRQVFSGNVQISLNTYY